MYNVQSAIFSGTTEKVRKLIDNPTTTTFVF